MRKQVRRLALFFVILLAGAIASAQQPMDFRQADSLTWQYYYAGDWDKLILTGKQALKNDVDYFYLRMRIAWAYFMKQQYRQAIPHYRQALTLNSADPDAMKLLLLSYEYSGRANDAILFSARLRRQNARELYNRYNKMVTQISLYGTFHQPFSNDAISEIEKSFNRTKSRVNEQSSIAESGTDGYHKAPRYMFMPRLAVSHRFNNRALVAHHQLGYLLRNEFSVSVKNRNIYPIDYHRIYQFDYRFALDYTPVSGLTITPAAHLFYARIPLFLTESYGFGRRAPYMVIANINKYSYVASLTLHKEFSFFSIGFSGAMGSINNVDQQQFGAHLKVFPLSNLNLYYLLNVWGHRQQTTRQATANIIHSHALGFRITRNLWLEAETILPQFSNFANTESTVVYNSPESTANLFALRAIVPLFKRNMKLFLSGGYFESSTGFVPEIDPLERVNVKNYPSINITGGILWSL